MFSNLNRAGIGAAFVCMYWLLVQQPAEDEQVMCT